LAIKDGKEALKIARISEKNDIYLKTKKQIVERKEKKWLNLKNQSLNGLTARMLQFQMRFQIL